MPFERFERPELGRPVDRVGIERPVEAPPQPIQDLREIAHFDTGIEPSRQRRVEMVVKVDQPRHDHAAAGIELLVALLFTILFAPGHAAETDQTHFEIGVSEYSVFHFFAL